MEVKEFNENRLSEKSEEGNDNAAEAEEKSTDLEKKEADKETGETQEEKSEEKSESDVPIDDIESPDPVSVKQMAKEKLAKEMKADKDKTFAEPVIGYLLKRCEDDLGLAQDVVQKHKTWQKCFDYIYGQARKQAKGNCAAVRDDVVYEWAEDYYHKDDKAEKKKKAKEAEKFKKYRVEVAKNAGNKSVSEVEKKEIDSKKSVQLKKQEEPKSKKNSKDMEGQMDLFSLISM